MGVRKHRDIRRLSTAMGVQAIVHLGQPGAFAHEPFGDIERRARSKPDLHHGARLGIVKEPEHTLAVRQDLVLVLHETGRVSPRRPDRSWSSGSRKPGCRSRGLPRPECRQHVPALSGKDSDGRPPWCIPKGASRCRRGGSRAGTPRASACATPCRAPSARGRRPATRNPLRVDAAVCVEATMSKRLQ